MLRVETQTLAIALLAFERSCEYATIEKKLRAGAKP